MELIDKSAVVAEIERRLKALYKDRDFNYLQIKELEALLSSLDTLEVKEVKEVDLDYIKKELDELIRNPNRDFGWGTLYDVATHFFELGLKTKGE